MLVPMNCPQCKSDMIKARVSRFTEEYDYCRACKKELKEMPTNNEALEIALLNGLAHVRKDTGVAPPGFVHYPYGFGGGLPSIAPTSPPTPPAPSMMPRTILGPYILSNGMKYHVVTGGAMCKNSNLDISQHMHEMLYTSGQCNCGAIKLIP